MRTRLLFLALSLHPNVWGIRTDGEDDLVIALGLSEKELEREEGNHSISGISATGVLEAEVSRMTVFKDLRVAGHTSLPTKTTYRVRADDNGTCSRVIAKFMDYAAYEADQPGDNTVAAKVLAKWDQTEEGEPINGQEAEEELERVAEEVGERGGLQVDMQMGEVLTMTDENEMVECMTGEPSALMEQPTTASGKPIVEGDMVFPDNESAQAALVEIASAHRYAGHRWPNGKVPYCVAASAPKDMQNALSNAVSHIERQVPCIKFEKVGTRFSKSRRAERCVYEPAVYITAAQSGSCYSYVGQIGGSQELNVGKGCWIMGIVAHEIGHALGMAHEQSRPDRDTYVKILWENIKKGTENNFEIDKNAYLGDSYDPYSLMHYAQYDFSTDRRNRKKTIDASDSRVGEILGQRDGFSEIDIKLLGKMYGCEDTVKPLVRNEDLAVALIGGGSRPSPRPSPRGGRGPSPRPSPRRPSPGPSPYPYSPMPAPRKKTYIKIAFDLGWQFERKYHSGVYVLAKAGTHSLTTPVRYPYRYVSDQVKYHTLYGFNWAGEEGLLQYHKGTALEFDFVAPDGKQLGYRTRVSAKYFFPSGICNNFCSLQMDTAAAGPKLRVCISVCKDGNHDCGCKTRR